MAANGVSPLIISRILGHKSVDFTAKTYIKTDTTSDPFRDAMSTLAQPKPNRRLRSVG